jgi:hypothetical protein
MDEYRQQWVNAAPSAVYEAQMPRLAPEAEEARKHFDPEYRDWVGQQQQHQPTAAASMAGAPAGATMKVPGSDGKLHWSDGKTDLGVAP